LARGSSKNTPLPGTLRNTGLSWSSERQDRVLRDVPVQHDPELAEVGEDRVDGDAADPLARPDEPRLPVGRGVRLRDGRFWTS
jgi:hypothetical protein